MDDGDEGEAIDDEDTPQWMDDKLVNVVGEDDFGPPEADVDLDAPELDDILADTPCLKGTGESNGDGSG